MACHLSAKDHEDLNEALADLRDALARIDAVQNRHTLDATLPSITAFSRAKTALEMADRDVHLAEHYLEPDAQAAA